MKKTSHALVLVLSLILALAAGCGQSAAPTQSTAPTQSAAPAQSETPGTAAQVAPHKFVFQCVGTEQGIDYTTGKAFADALLEASGGALEVKVYGTDQLAGGNTNKALEMLATGEVDIGCYAQSVSANINPKIGICTLPWTFTSYADVNEKMAGAAGAYLKEQYAEVGIEWVDYTHNALRQLSNS
jgi:TRAP-type C4-dicarboxylate transport system substrate-binding protein